MATKSLAIHANQGNSVNQEALRAPVAQRDYTGTEVSAQVVLSILSREAGRKLVASVLKISIAQPVAHRVRYVN